MDKIGKLYEEMFSLLAESKRVREVSDEAVKNGDYLGTISALEKAERIKKELKWVRDRLTKEMIRENRKKNLPATSFRSRLFSALGRYFR